MKVSHQCLQAIETLSANTIEQTKSICLAGGDHRRSGPVSEKQRLWREKFKSFAASCRGKGDYRACMRERLKSR